MLVRMWSKRSSHSLQMGMQNSTVTLGDCLVVSHNVFLPYSWIKSANFVTGFSLFIGERVLHLIVCVYECVYVRDCELCSYLLMGTLIVKLMKLDFQNFPYINIFQIPLPNFVFKIAYSLFF